MAYPFPYRAPGLTFKQFAQAVKATGLHTVDRISNPNDDREALYRFVRKDALLIDAVEYVEDDTWQMMASTFRSLCARLNLDANLIGGTHDDSDF